MNWRTIRACPWIDTRARFVANIPANGTLLDLGSSDGETLRHMAELRPDIRFTAADIHPQDSSCYPSGSAVVSLDVTKDSFPWLESSFDAVSCFQLVEHLTDIDHLLKEACRVLKPRSCLLIETPQPWTIDLPAMKGAFTYNFYDDPTHIRVWTAEEIALRAAQSGFHVVKSGVSRNILFALSWPLYALMPFSRKKMTAKIHWMGWSGYVLLMKNQNR